MTGIRLTRAACLALGLAAAAAGAAGAQFGLTDSSARVSVRAVPAHDRVAAGGQFPAAVVFDIQPGWHIQTNDPVVPPVLGDASFYIKTEVKAIAEGGPDGIVVHPQSATWPLVHMAQVAFTGSPVEFGVFDGTAPVVVPVTVAPDVGEGTHRVPLAVTYQACDDSTCLAPVYDQPVSLDITVASPADLSARPAVPQEPALFADFDPAVFQSLAAGGAASPVNFDLFGTELSVNAGTSSGFVLVLVMAAVGGLLLNFTPCVLPLIPIKVMSLQQAAGSRRRGLALGTVMSSGVIAFWLVLGGLIAFVAGFTAANQLFQYPAFTLGVGVIIGVMAVGMMGRFSVTLPQRVYAVNPTRNTVGGSFLFGILVAVLSTPCTAPFMGAAAAWAATQDPAITLATFAAIGLGMALPYFVFSVFPGLLHRLPRTGPASQVVKDVMGLLMLAAACYFLGVGLSGLMVQPPDPPSRAYWYGVAFFVGAAGAWTAYKALTLARGTASRVAFTGLGALMVAGAAYFAVGFTDSGPIDWTYYTEDRFASALASDRVVVMDFTAEWCLNCKALEESVLNSPEIAALLAESDVQAIKVDLTGNNPAGNEMLRQTGRVTIPLLVIYTPDGEPAFEGDFYTIDQVKQGIADARAKVAESG
jgi:thiol:disulfide interchange protein DsbD